MKEKTGLTIVPIEQRQRSIEAKIERLRQRLAKITAGGKIAPELAAVLAGFLDLLGDEL